MHGQDWTGQDVSGWWASEKLRGWRVLWTGTEYQTRQGHRLDVPTSWLEGMPDFALDGELWAGLQPHEGKIKSAVANGRWHELSFHPFDVPGLEYEAARQTLFLSDFPPHVKPVSSKQIKSNAEAFQMRDAVLAKGGEGIMLRMPETPYRFERVDYLLKLKA